MANRVVEASAPVPTPRPVGQHPGTTPEPTWVTWAPWGAIAWALAYGAVRIWWAIGDAQAPPPLGTDLLVFSGWGAVGLCVAVLGVALALKMAPWRHPLWIAAWAASVALLTASALLLLDVVGALTPGLGVQFHPAVFFSRAAALGGAVLMGAAAEGYRRRWRSDCLFCGRTGADVRPVQLPRWARWGAYAAVAGCVVRLGAQMAVGFAELQGSGWSLLGFEAGFVLAGTVLPLALVHRWGRVFPAWTPALAGRRVPRWLLLTPAFGIAGAMTAYFGFTFVMLAVGTVTGTWDGGDSSLSLGFFWVAVPAYLTWGLGLGAAAVGYYRVTRPRCRMCGQ